MSIRITDEVGLDKPIYVTQPCLPPLKDFMPYLEEIWENKWLTNNGPMHKRLESALAEYLEVPYVSLFCNGMAALQTSLNCLRVEGEVITTPFTFVATTHAISLHGCTPVFCDIDPVNFNIDPNKIEALITDKTTAIMGVHVYGQPCDTKKIEAIANRHNLKVIYDAAHAFGVKENGESILLKGDLSILSFHATKVFNTLEGGAIISHDLETKTRIDQLKNFGIENEESTLNIAGNGKMNEVQAAFGLMQLDTVSLQIKRRQRVSLLYREGLGNIKKISVMHDQEGVQSNYGYFPIIVMEGFPLSRDELYELLKKKGINTRKYFYPLVSNLRPYQDSEQSDINKLTVSRQISNNILCLPIYPELAIKAVHSAIEAIVDCQIG